MIEPLPPPLRPPFARWPSSHSLCIPHAWRHRRLWHQLTLKLEEFVKSFTGTTGHPEVVALYDSFIKRFEGKVNKLKLSVINVQIANQCASTLLVLALTYLPPSLSPPVAPSASH